MKKSIRKIERRTRGRDIGTNTTDRIQGFDGNDRMRWRLIAANDEATQAWRGAA